MNNQNEEISSYEQVLDNLEGGGQSMGSGGENVSIHDAAARLAETDLDSAGDFQEIVFESDNFEGKTPNGSVVQKLGEDENYIEHLNMNQTLGAENPAFNTSGLTSPGLVTGLTTVTKKPFNRNRMLMIGGIAGAFALLFVIMFGGLGDKGTLAKGKKTAGESSDSNSNTQAAEDSTIRFGDVPVGNPPSTMNSVDNFAASQGDANNAGNSATRPDYSRPGDVVGSSQQQQPSYSPNYTNLQPTPVPAPQYTAPAQVTENPELTANTRVNAAQNGQIREQAWQAPESENDRFELVMNKKPAAAENKDGKENADSPEVLPQTSGNQLIAKGTKLVLVLEEPIRSGIATTVTAKIVQPVKTAGGQTIVPAGSTAFIPIAAQEANGRVFNDRRQPIAIQTPMGAEIVFYGTVKDSKGLAGLSGKVTKQGGKNLLQRVGGGLVRGTIGALGSTVGGGSLSTIGSEIENVSNGMGGGDNEYVRDASRIVEITQGVNFTIIVGY